MDETDAYRLNSLREYILENLDGKHVVDYLVEVEVLEIDEEERICAQPSAKRRTEELLDILLRRPAAMPHFKQALAKDYPFILKKLNDVTVPDHIQTGQGPQWTSQPQATGAAAGPNITRTTERSSNSTVTSTNICGNNNFVIIGGVNSKINFHKK